MLPFEHGKSWYLGRLLGVPVRLHWSLALMVGLQFVRALLSGGLTIALWVIPVEVLIIASIWFHEMAHSMVGRSYGMRTLEMTLHAFGGFVRQAGQPSDRQQMLISAAGPLSNIVLWLLLNGVANVVGGYGPARWIALSVADFNLLIGLFNMIPAFPLDGGSVLVHGLRLTAPHAQASWLAYSIGVWISVPLVVFGLITSNLLLSLIFFFTYGACSERLAATGAVGGAQYWKGRVMRPRRTAKITPLHVDWKRFSQPGAGVKDPPDDDPPPTIN